jgi:hypothetical protein
MATNIMSLFNTEDSFAPQQQAFQQRLMQATDPRAFIAAVGGNMGAQLGQAVPGLLGMPNKQQKVRRIMQAVGSISDPLGQAQEAYKLFQQEGMPQEAQAVLQSIQELQKESDLGKYAEIVGSKVAEKDVGIVTVAETAAESMPKIKDTLDVLRKTKDGPITGIGAEILLNFERVKAKLLKDKGSIEKVKNTELLDAFLGSEVFPMITALGIGARGLDTPAEREFLRGVFTGTIAMSNATLIEMTEIRERIAQRAVDKYNKKLSEGYFKNYEKAQDRKLNPITFGTVTTTNWEPN